MICSSEYRQNSRGLIQIQKLDPEPDSDAEDSAKLEGVEPQLLSNGERVYLGLSVSLLDQKEAIPFLTPERERLLEYDISRAIARVMTPDKPVIGVMSSLPVMGMSAMMPMQEQGEPPWVLIEELKRDFSVKEIEPNATRDPGRRQGAPGHSSERNFGRDAVCARSICPARRQAHRVPRSAGGARSQGASEGFGSPPSKSSFDKLLKAWGITFEDSKVLADLDFVARTGPGRAPTVLALNRKGDEQGRHRDRGRR